MLDSGHATGNKTTVVINLGEKQWVNYPLDPYFDLKIAFDDHSDTDYKIDVCLADVFNEIGETFGFEYLQADANVYAFYTHGGTKYRTALTISNPDTFHRYRAEVSEGVGATKVIIKFYVDSVLVHTYSEVYCYFEDIFALGIGCRSTTTAVADHKIWLSNIVYSQIMPSGYL